MSKAAQTDAVRICNFRASSLADAAIRASHQTHHWRTLSSSGTLDLSSLNKLRICCARCGRELTSGSACDSCGNDKFVVRKLITASPIPCPSGAEIRITGFSEHRFLHIDLPKAVEKKYEIRYTLDGAQPTTASPLYTRPVPLRDSVITRVCARFYKDDTVSQTLIHDVKKQAKPAAPRKKTVSSTDEVFSCDKCGAEVTPVAKKGKCSRCGASYKFDSATKQYKLESGAKKKVAPTPPPAVHAIKLPSSPPTPTYTPPSPTYTPPSTPTYTPPPTPAAPAASSYKKYNKPESYLSVGEAVVFICLLFLFIGLVTFFVEKFIHDPQELIGNWLSLIVCAVLGFLYFIMSGTVYSMIHGGLGMPQKKEDSFGLTFFSLCVLGWALLNLDKFNSRSELDVLIFLLPCVAVSAGTARKVCYDSGYGIFAGFMGGASIVLVILIYFAYLFDHIRIRGVNDILDLWAIFYAVHLSFAILNMFIKEED